jgi:hypothetical protein
LEHPSFIEAPPCSTSLEASSRIGPFRHSIIIISDTNMADPEVATKAPESDAAEETKASLFPGDTPAQKGASLGVRGSLEHYSLY